MKTLLFIDSCIRGESSRTKIVANAFLTELLARNDYSVETVDLNCADIAPLDKRAYEHREKLLAEEQFDDPTFRFARQFAKADLVVVAAPFWDMGIPAKLKTYFENVSVSGFTFKCNEQGSVGLCRAAKMIYITTRGMEIEDGSFMEQASPYLRALAVFFGIRSFYTVSAKGLDVYVDKVDELVSEAVDRAKKLAVSVSE